MPELPEVEHIRRTLSAKIVGSWVLRTRVERDDVIRGEIGVRDRGRALLRDGRISDVRRHGKRLAILVQDGRVLEFGLGMTGQFLLESPGGVPAERNHRHVIWYLGDRCGGMKQRLVWRDPRRFGGLTPLGDPETLNKACWGVLGPDALEIDEETLFDRLKKTQRALKTALLDQRLLAGVGNIYADEALHAAGIAPERRSHEVSRCEVGGLLKHVKRILREAVELGGSTIRDHKDPLLQSGAYQGRHAVYGRPGEPCQRCANVIRSDVVGGRTTHWCEACQI